MIEQRVYVRPELVGIDRRRTRERGKRGVCANKLTGAQWDELADRYAVTRHDERLASVEGAHDVAAAVAEFALGDFSSHDGRSVARVLRNLACRRPGLEFARPAACLRGIAREERRDLGALAASADLLGIGGGDARSPLGGDG